MAGHDQPIHLPPPSLSPFTIGVGVTLISFGVLWSVILVAIGLVIFLIGLATWLIDDARAYGEAPDAGGHGGAHH
jgi:hypothetical protein